MKCPHCGIHFHENWDDKFFERHGKVTSWRYSSVVCPECKQMTLRAWTQNKPSRMIEPTTSNRGPISSHVPSPIARDYFEACNVLPVSAKASAALSRRCLQHILASFGYKQKDLAKQLDALLAEEDPKKALPAGLQSTIDAIRNFGNFSAHPIDEQTTLQIIEVEPEEAEWCLEILEELFDHYYERPAVAAAKKAALDAKLASAGKPPSK